MTEYSKQLKDSDELKLQLVKLVREDGCTIAEAARALSIAPRSAQLFFQEGTNWAKSWWSGFEYVAEERDELDDHEASIMDEISRGRETSFRTDYKLVFNDTVPKVVDNSRILLISDMHIPYHHKDTLAFLQHLKDKYNPTRIICLGDELDKHALSFHDHDPDLPSAGDELKLALPVIAKLKEMFPVMDILESNHGSLVYRKAHAHGIPRHYLKSYNDVLGVDNNWQWHYDMTVELPNGNKCYLHHGKSANVSKTSQTMSMCAVQGHYHETFKIEYWGNPNGLYWGLQAGCLIDDKAYAFNYNNCNLKRPIIGTAMIVDSIPILEPLIMDRAGNWIGK